ncbi:MAG: hypothetical protein WBH29_05230 [Bacilli bacterium]
MVGSVLAMTSALCINFCAEMFHILVKKANIDPVKSLLFQLLNWGPPVLGLVGCVVYDNKAQIGGGMMLVSGIIMLSGMFFRYFPPILGGILLIVGGAPALAQKA